MDAIYDIIRMYLRNSNIRKVQDKIKKGVTIKVHNPVQRINGGNKKVDTVLD